MQAFTEIIDKVKEKHVTHNLVGFSINTVNGEKQQYLHFQKLISIVQAFVDGSEKRI